MGLFNAILGHASEVSLEKIQKEFEMILIPEEIIEKAYKLSNDMFVFTSKRLILIHKKGLTGSKAEYLSVPYKNILKFSKESAGLMDLDAELKIWIVGDEIPLKTQFGKNDNVNEIYQILSYHILK